MEPKQIKCYCGHTIYCDCGQLEEPIISDEIKQRAKNYMSLKGALEPKQERMYSEENILKSFDNLGFKQISSEELNSLPYQPFITDEDGDVWVIDKEKWFEQFKKK